MSSNENLPEKREESNDAVIRFDSSRELDLSVLPEKQRQELMVEYAKGVLDVNKRAADLAVDVKTLQLALETMTGATATVTEQGSSVTLSHTQTSTAGRTEILMGNSEKAQQGKFTKTQTGERDWTPYYIFGGIAAGALVLIALANSLG